MFDHNAVTLESLTYLRTPSPSWLPRDSVLAKLEVIERRLSSGTITPGQLRWLAATMKVAAEEAQKDPADRKVNHLTRKQLKQKKEDALEIRKAMLVRCARQGWKGFVITDEEQAANEFLSGLGL